MSKNMVDITPDVRLLRVLRNTGFNNLTAMGEILDNATDAGATCIDIYIQGQSNQKVGVTVVDNGKGMGNTLSHALTLAKELKTGIDQLGKYGMGLKTAALSLTTQMEIFTQNINEDVMFGEFNINKMEAIREFKTNVRVAAEEEVDFYKQRVGDSRSGTVILLKNCDRIEVRPETFVSQLKVYIGTTYRSFIKRGVTFTVSCSHVKGDVVEAIDPLMRDDKQTYIVRNRETYLINYTDREGKVKTTFIELSAVVLPRASNQGRFVDGKEIPLTINQANQGFYFYREGRQVASAITWSNVFGERHPSKNRFRLEVNLKSQLDNEVRMNFQKGNISPTVHFKKQLAGIVELILEEMRGIIDGKINTRAILKTKQGVVNEQKPVETVAKEENKNIETEESDGAYSSFVPTRIPNKLQDSFSRATVGEEYELQQRQKETTNDTSSLEEVNETYQDKTTYLDILDAAYRVSRALQDVKIPEYIKDEIYTILGIQIKN